MEEIMKSDKILFTVMAILFGIIGISILVFYKEYIGCGVIPFAIAVFFLLLLKTTNEVDEDRQTNQLIQKEDQSQLEILNKQYWSVADTAIPEEAEDLWLHPDDKKYYYGSFMFCWDTGKDLCFFDCEPVDNYPISRKLNLEIKKIPKNKIKYFKVEGDLINETKISGGGGGGSSISGALVGGIVAGGVGAIIGSRKGIDPIKSEFITHDNRKIVFCFENQNNKIESYHFIYDNAIKVFNDLIPNKNYDLIKVQERKTKQSQKKTSTIKKSESYTDNLRELAKLRDEGIITDEEFNEKKNIILRKIT